MHIRLSDPNAGSLVLFKRYGCPPDSDAHKLRRWELGRVAQTYFVDPSGRTVEPDFDFDRTDLTPWVLVDPEKPEGCSAPTCVEVPLDGDHIDPIVHGADLP